MKISFVLPNSSGRPIGGYKIVYEYANRLIKAGADVSIIYMNSNVLKSFKYRNTPYCVVRALTEIITFIEPKWFKLDCRVHKISNLNIKKLKYVYDSDVVIATAIETVDYAFNLCSNAKKIYLIQGFECWGKYTIDDVIQTFKTESIKITISKWLKEKVDKYSPEPGILISNPIDVQKYRCIIPILRRNRYTIGVLFHKAGHKGFAIAFEVIMRLKTKYPELTVYMFGAEKPGFCLPEWIDFTLRANQNETINIYNNCRVFLCATVQEGFGLTGFESIACGCVLVSTDFEGAREYTINEYNSLLAPVNDVDALCNNVERAFQDDELACRISQQGIDSVKSHSWEKAFNKFWVCFIKSDFSEIPAVWL